jgi:hypothetical protein
MMRKGRQSRDNVDHFLRRKRKEIEMLECDNLNIENSAKREMTELHNKSQEYELREKIASIQAKDEKDLRDAEVCGTQEVQKLSESITLVRQENESAIAALEQTDNTVRIERSQRTD